MKSLISLILQVNPLEGFFFGSGKAMVAAGVIIIIMLGLAIWMFRMESRMNRLNQRLDLENPGQSDLDKS